MKNIGIIILIIIITTTFTTSYRHDDAYIDTIINYSVLHNEDIEDISAQMIMEDYKDSYEELEVIDEYELYLLACLINAEAGSNWCSDKMQYYVGSVVLNRVDSYEFPNTIYDVIYQKGQYACIDNGSINNKPCDRALRIAEDLLTNGSVLPKNVIFQAEFKQGNGTYCKEQNMYFCYK